MFISKSEKESFLESILNLGEKSIANAKRLDKLEGVVEKMRLNFEAYKVSAKNSKNSDVKFEVIVLQHQTESLMQQVDHLRFLLRELQLGKEVKVDLEPVVLDFPVTAPKKRGRPVGSKNKTTIAI